MDNQDFGIREPLFRYIRRKYKVNPEHPWLRYPEHVVFRHSDNQKWFALIMRVEKSKLGLPGEEPVDILNIKLPDPLLADLLVQRDGFFPAYHIRRGNWISILLDGSVPLDEICRWLGESYLTTASRETGEKLRPPKEWIVPANPQYFDVQKAFDTREEINWKQGKGIRKGDTVYLYVAAPVSAILYRCRVTETDIPSQNRNSRVSVKTLMRIRLQRRYPPERFTFAVLGSRYGIRAVRGPRGLPDSLSEALKK